MTSEQVVKEIQELNIGEVESFKVAALCDNIIRDYREHIKNIVSMLAILNENHVNYQSIAGLIKFARKYLKENYPELEEKP